MNLNNQIEHALKRYNFKLNKTGIKRIAVQVTLLYGYHPTQRQVNEVVSNNSIQFINDMKI